MAKPEWGTKRLCPQCGMRYYDMKKKPPVCPSCGAVFDPDAQAKTKRSRAPVEEKHQKPKAKPEEEIEDIPLDVEDAIEDADELGEDNLDVEDVYVMSDEDETSR